MRMALAAVILGMIVLAAPVKKYEAVPVADTYIWLNYADRNHGRHETLAFGSAAPKYNDDRFQSVVKWDLPSALDGADVLSAHIVLSVRYCGPGDGTVDLYLMTGPWTEAATWRLRDGKSEKPWPKGYGALGATTNEVLSRTEVPEIPMKTGGEEPTGKVVRIDATRAARRWAGGHSNYGVLLRMVHVQYSPCNLNVYSREAKESGLRPRLIIRYKSSSRKAADG